MCTRTRSHEWKTDLPLNPYLEIYYTTHARCTVHAILIVRVELYLITIAIFKKVYYSYCFVTVPSLCCADNWPTVWTTSPRDWPPGPTVRGATRHHPWFLGWTVIFARRSFWTTTALHTGRTADTVRARHAHSTRHHTTTTTATKTTERTNHGLNTSEDICRTKDDYRRHTRKSDDVIV